MEQGPYLGALLPMLQGAAGGCGAPAFDWQATLWCPRSAALVGTLTASRKLGGHHFLGRGKEGRREGEERSLSPSKPQAQPQVLREGGQLPLRRYK